MNTRITSLEKMLGGPRDGALLRYSLGNEYLNAGNLEAAASHFAEAARRDEKYSAAWKGLGKARSQLGDRAGARDAYRQGIAAASEKGDVQAAKEMAVFLRRLERDTSESEPAD